MEGGHRCDRPGAGGDGVIAVNVSAGVEGASLPSSWYWW